MGTLTEISIFNDDEKPQAISIWCAGRLTGNQPVCVKARSFDLVTIGNPTDTRWYAYKNLLHEENINERVQLSRTGWLKVDLGMWAPPAYIWFTKAEPMVALPAWDKKAAKTLGIEYDDWHSIMKKHATNVFNTQVNLVTH